MTPSWSPILFKAFTQRQDSRSMVRTRVHITRFLRLLVEATQQRLLLFQLAIQPNPQDDRCSLPLQFRLRGSEWHQTRTPLQQEIRLAAPHVFCARSGRRELARSCVRETA